MAEIGKDLKKAKALLEKGSLVAIPTETVYGLAANATNISAVANIFETKQRPKFDPLILHTNDLSKMYPFIEEVPGIMQQLADRMWPGPLTLLVHRKGDAIPDLVTSGLPRVAIRIPNHSITLKLLASLDFPLAAPSANPFGYISPTNPIHVDDQLGNRIPYILDGGPCEVGIESTIIGMENNQPVVYRLGGLPIEEIEAITGPIMKIKTSESNPAAPGLLESHYSPLKQLVLGELPELIEKYRSMKIGILSFNTSFPSTTSSNQLILSKKGDLIEAASNLFGALRKLDNAPIDIILTELVPNQGIGKAINDRLIRAAT